MRATVTPEQIDEVFALQTPGVLATGERLTYACGLYIDSYRGLAIVQHSGGYGGYGAQLLRFPAQRFSVACLCNTVEANPSALAFRIAALYLGDQLALPQPTAPTAAQTSLEDVGARTDLGQYAGAYLSEELDATYTIDVIDGALGVSTGISTGALTLGIALDKVSLQSSGPDEFAGPWFIRMRFNRTERGDISGFDLTMPRAEQIPFLLQRC